MSEWRMNIHLRHSLIRPPPLFDKIWRRLYHPVSVTGRILARISNQKRAAPGVTTHPEGG